MDRGESGDPEGVGMMVNFHPYRKNRNIRKNRLRAPFSGFLRILRFLRLYRKMKTGGISHEALA